MDKLCRGIPGYYVVLWVWWNWQFFYLSYSLGIMASWKSHAKGIKGRWHHLVPGPQIETKPHNSVLWAWAGVLGHGKDDKVIWSFPQLIFLNMTLACEICIRSHWAKNLVACFGQWDDLMAKHELGRGIHSYNAMLWIWRNQHFVYPSQRLGIMIFLKLTIACKTWIRSHCAKI